MTDTSPIDSAADVVELVLPAAEPAESTSAPREAPETIPSGPTGIALFFSHRRALVSVPLPAPVSAGRPRGRADRRRDADPPGDGVREPRRHAAG